MSKHTITFANVGISVTVPRGTRIVEVAEKAGAGIPFGCKENDCGDCIVEVLQGADNLSPASALENELLQVKAPKPGCRLACQAMVLGDVTVKPA